MTNWTNTHRPLQAWVRRRQSVRLESPARSSCGAGTSAVCSELLYHEMCIENTSRSIRGQRSVSRDSVHSLHAQMSLAISQMKIENASITSPGTDRKGLPCVPFQGEFLGLMMAISGMKELETASISNAPILQVGILRPRGGNGLAQGQRVRIGGRVRIQNHVP